MKTKFTAKNNEVSLTWKNPITEEIETATYFVPYLSDDKLGYVRLRIKNSPQICERLSGSGNTLMATPKTLLSVIKREHKKRLIELKKEMQRQ